jgi:RsiW-degrading membrane proteinase PrsW (M82 family)
MDPQTRAALGPNETRLPILRRLWAWGLSGTVFLLAALTLVVMLTDRIGVAGFLLAAVVSTTVIGIVVPVFLWVDRLEAEPPVLLWFAFGWGALVATTASAVTSLAVMDLLTSWGLDAERLGAVLVAPVVEELAKALGVVVVFAAARREFNGVVDGITYAGLVAVGFAFVEDILYLGRGYESLGHAGLLSVFVLRCLFTPFAHPMFTVCFGLALGLIAHRRQWRYVVVPLAGYIVAVAAHAWWNAAASGPSWLLVYVLVQVPLFAGFVALLVWARRREARTLRDHLTTYGLNGWFTPAEVSMLTSPTQRRQARRWARQRYGNRGEHAMRAFQDESAELAIAREHLMRGGRSAWWTERERRLLGGAAHHRTVLLSLPRSDRG